MNKQKTIDTLPVRYMQEVQQNIRALRLIRNYERLLAVVHPSYWRDTMTPFWIEQKDQLQTQAQELLGEEQVPS